VSDLIDTAVTDIIGLYTRQGGNAYLGEPVTQLQHAAQAADLARSEGCDDDVVCAAFLHDVGHLCAGDQPHTQMGEFGIAHHERIGADFLRGLGFSDRVVHLVGQHVNAKRYLTRTRPDYFARLSQASKRTLKFQGGPMNDAEAGEFEKDPLFALTLKMRQWDEAAKVADLTVLPLQHYGELFRSHLERRSAPLREEQLEFWRTHGYLKIEGHLDTFECAALSAWVEDLRARPETPGKWMKYFERAANGDRQLCRVENFIQYHEGFDRLITGPRTLAMVSALFGEGAVLFKEKINYKLPGGAGFAPHQDAPAFTSFAQSLHITLMISVDATTPDNGCLEVAPHPGGRTTLPLAADLTIDPDTTGSLAWFPITTAPGDLLFFDSYLPHRSASNRTGAPRRALYLTYNKAAEGNVRDAYYREKRAAFPPDVEREPGKDYGDTGVFNVGNPIY
jgi:phosphonate degradation associated HDIG domain protein